MFDVKWAGEMGENTTEENKRNPDRSTNFKLMVSLYLGFIIPIMIVSSTKCSVNTFLPVPLGVTYLLNS